MEKYSKVQFNTRYSESFLKLIEYVKSIGNSGHSFDIVVDPDNKDYKKSFEFDGDGSDFISNLKIDKIDEKEFNITEARDYQVSYNDNTRKVKVVDHGKTRYFRNISPSEYMTLYNGLHHNPKSGFLHFNAFLSRNFDKEIGGEFDKEYLKWRREQDDKKYEKEFQKDLENGAYEN